MGLTEEKIGMINVMNRALVRLTIREVAKGKDPAAQRMLMDMMERERESDHQGLDTS